VAQYRQLVAAQAGEPLSVSTLDALKDDPVLAETWLMHQKLGQVMACAFDGRGDPDQEPVGFQKRLAIAAGCKDFEGLKRHLSDLRARARDAFAAVLPAISSDGI
jgi:glutamate-ammonia-ligase adenylyltransferase